MAHIGIDARLTYYRTGGISTYIRRLIQALEVLDKQHQYTIFQSRKATQPITQHFATATLWTPAHHRIERLALSVELLPHRLDILHSPDFIPPYRGAKRHVITVHDLTFLHYPQYLTADSRRYYNAQIQAAVKHADHILVVSESTKRDLITMLNVPAEKMTVQPHGAGEQYKPLPPDETAHVLKTLDLPPHYFLHVGTIEPRKNIRGLLQGYQLLLEKLPDAPPVVLVGKRGWLMDEMRPTIEMLEKSGRVVWRENVTDEQLPAVYNGAMALVSPSFYEGFGMPALEAMACGTVPIVSNNSSFPEVVGDVGLLIDPENPHSIADALYQATHDLTWRKTMERRAIEHAALFTWEKSAHIALRVYAALI